jgi:GTP-binding protein
MLVDEVTIHIKAGKGGDGAVSFSKIPQVLGPTGGDGGDGGSVYVEGVSNLSALRQFRFKKDFFAQDGENGKVRNQSGRAGDDLVLKIPVGTIIHNLDKKERIEVLEVGKRILVAYGGKGGKGNNFFKSSTNTSPMQSEAGRPGQEFECLLELQLIADIGLIGLPNAGKSSLLNELTRAAAKVANYPFTTLEPAPAQMTTAGISGLAANAREVTLPAMLCPHRPIRFGFTKSACSKAE